MRVSPPKVVVWWLAFALLVLAILVDLNFIQVDALSAYGFWLAVLSSAILLLATRLRGL